MASHDRRCEHRVRADFFANRYIDGIPQLCRVTNVSRHGVRVRRLGGPLKREGRVQLELLFPGQREPVYCLGEVVDQNEESLGIRIGDLSPDERGVVDRFVRQRTSVAINV